MSGILQSLLQTEVVEKLERSRSTFFNKICKIVDEIKDEAGDPGKEDKVLFYVKSMDKFFHQKLPEYTGTATRVEETKNAFTMDDKAMVQALNDRMQLLEKDVWKQSENKQVMEERLIMLESSVKDSDERVDELVKDLATLKREASASKRMWSSQLKETKLKLKREFDAKGKFYERRLQSLEKLRNILNSRLEEDDTYSSKLDALNQKVLTMENRAFSHVPIEVKELGQKVDMVDQRMDTFEKRISDEINEAKEKTKHLKEKEEEWEKQTLNDHKEIKQEMERLEKRSANEEKELKEKMDKYEEKTQEAMEKVKEGLKYALSSVCKLLLQAAGSKKPITDKMAFSICKSSENRCVKHSQKHIDIGGHFNERNRLQVPVTGTYLCLLEVFKGDPDVRKRKDDQEEFKVSGTVVVNKNMLDGPAAHLEVLHLTQGEQLAIFTSEKEISYNWSVVLLETKSS